ncbi:MAG: site-specific recombinase [Burkholderiaceae bacterium]|nr:site-specific recombinase [Burkholderiaceae bacterium]
MPKRPADLTGLLDGLDPGATRAQRHLWLVNLLAWVRAGMGSGDDPAGAVARLRLMLDAVQARPEWQARWHAWWQLFKDTVDPAPLLADFGFAPRTGFMSALGERVRRKLLPVTPDTDDLITLFDLLLPDRRDAIWLKALDGETLDRIQRLLFEAPSDDAWGPGVLMDALTYCVGQVSAAGFSSEIRSRMSHNVSQAHPFHSRPFHALPGRFEAFKAVVKTDGAHSAPALASAQALRDQLDACRHAAYTVYAHLEENGISVGIVFRLSQLRERMVRIRQLLDCLQSDHAAQAAARLLAQLAQVGQDKRSIRALVASSTHMTAAKVAERGAESGEHYITRNAAEYRHMLGTAAGGGAVLAFTTWAKFAIYGLGLSAFWSGLAFGMNYAVSFVIVMLLHWTVATKQPAVTAPAMAARLKDMSAPDAVDHFIDEVAHLLRSQIAAIIGNLGLVIPGVLLICAALKLGGFETMVDVEHAHHVLHDQSLLGPTALYAAFTGVLLFASSIIAGWVENWFVLYQLESAIAWNPRSTRLLGMERARRWSKWLRANVSGLAASISLGLMLGLVPAFTGFFGLALEVRHVTLSTGQVAAAAYTLGLGVLATPEFWWAVAGIAVIGPLNLLVSFFLAFRLALAAHSVPPVERRLIRQAFWQRVRQAPASFLFPPREPPTGDPGPTPP